LGTGGSPFGEAGEVVAGPSGVICSLVIRPRGRLVAAGAGDGRFALARYKPDGRLDRSFSSNGRVRADIRAYVTSAAIGARNRIVVAGDRSKLAIARFIGDRRR